MSIRRRLDAIIEILAISPWVAVVGVKSILRELVFSVDSLLVENHSIPLFFEEQR